MIAAILGSSIGLRSDRGESPSLPEYVRARLESSFPQLSDEEIGIYAPAIAQAIGTGKVPADYVLSGLYYVGTGETSFITACEYPESHLNCVTDEERARTGLHFAAPGYETAELVTLPQPKAEFDDAIRDAIALDMLADSLKGRITAVAGPAEVMAEIRDRAPYFVKIGLLPSIDYFIPPLSVEGQDSSTFSDKGGAAYTLGNRIYVGSEYLAGASERNAGYLRQIEIHETAHINGVDDETYADIAAMGINALAARDGRSDSGYAAAMTLSLDALWTAVFSMDYPQHPPPSDFQGRMEVLENLPCAQKSYSATGDMSLDWHRGSGLERMSDDINGAIDGAIESREAAALAYAVSRIYASESPQELASFNETYAEWKGAGTGIVDSRLQYRVMPYVLVRDAERDEGMMTAGFIVTDKNGEFLPMSERKQQTIDLGALVSLLNEARLNYSAGR